MIGFAAQRLMELEIEEWPEGRRALSASSMRAGTVELHIPELRKGSYFPAFLEPAAWPTTRAVDDLV
jgi:putative transposase